MLPFTLDELRAAVDAGRVSERWHPTLPYRILNYTPEIQYSKSWDRVTRACRGLILDGIGNIVARPYEKFFNLGEVNLPFQFDDPVEIMDKADGSLGILYPVPMGWGADYHIATRGSFESEQAKMATRIFTHQFGHLYPQSGYTMLFEIVGPDNRIVLEYPENELILLGAVQNDTGYYVSPQQAKYMWFSRENDDFDEWPGRVIEVMNFKTLTDALGHMNRDNAEGYVVRHHNFMVKLKQPDYIDLHAIVTNLSEKKVWEHMRDGKFSTLLDIVPDEWHGWLTEVSDRIMENFTQRQDAVMDAWAGVVSGIDITLPRGEVARYIMKNYKEYSSYMFTLLDGGQIAPALWSEVKPKNEQTTQEV